MYGLKRSTWAVGVLNRSHHHSSSFGEPQVKVANDVLHTPVFSQACLKYLLPIVKTNASKKRPTRFLDLTFGHGGHTSLVLDYSVPLLHDQKETSLTVVAVDRDRASFHVAQEMSTKYPTGCLLPVNCRFSELPEKLESLNMQGTGYFDAAILETGVSNLQWDDISRGFCHLRKGILDLRMDEPTCTPKVPSASEVLQHIDERSLIRLLKVYGDLNHHAKYVAQAIIEARYMFHRFKTNQELFQVIQTAARNLFATSGQYSGVEKASSSFSEKDVCVEMMEKTINALRLFVNNELNELDFCMRNVAPRLLKADAILLVIAHLAPEVKIVHKALFEAAVKQGSRPYRPWTPIHSEPLTLSLAEQTLHPRFQSAKLIGAQKSECDVSQLCYKF